MGGATAYSELEGEALSELTEFVEPAGSRPRDSGASRFETPFNRTAADCVVGPWTFAANRAATSKTSNRPIVELAFEGCGDHRREPQ